MIDSRTRRNPRQSEFTARFRFAVIIPLAFALSGCRKARYEEPIEGIVCVERHEVIQSYLLPGNDEPGDCDPIAKAKIELAFDKEAKNLVKGFHAESDAKGRYRIQIKDIPRSETEYGNDYYLIVTKDGYERLVAEIRIGPRSSSQRNTVVLMPLKKK